MPLKRYMRGHREMLMAEGILQHDFEALSEVQRKCMQRLNFTIQKEQESYLLRHPEISAMLTAYIANRIRQQKSTTRLQNTLAYFVKPAEELDADIRQLLDLPPDTPYISDYLSLKAKPYEDSHLLSDLQNIISEPDPSPPLKTRTLKAPKILTPETLSSSFLSIRTSESTLPTPEPVATPPLTLYETLYNMVSYAVDKAAYARVTDDDIKYDTAYVELMHTVEVAMEIPVKAIREDIGVLLRLAHRLFDTIIDEKDRIAAEIAWENRMRKKLKTTLRRQWNFKGYETPSTPKSTVTSHTSYKIPPPSPIEYHTQFAYNRYPKNRFGIYAPQETKFSNESVTVGDLVLEKPSVQDDGYSMTSNKSRATNKSKSTIRSGTTNKSGSWTRFHTTSISSASIRSLKSQLSEESQSYQH